MFDNCGVLRRFNSLYPNIIPNYIQCIIDLDKESKKIISESILTTIEASIIF